MTGAFLIEMHRVRPDPNQPRRKLDTQKQWELAASIERHGILQPITVQYLDKENVYQVITGQRRYQAAVLTRDDLINVFLVEILHGDRL